MNLILRRRGDGTGIERPSDANTLLRAVRGTVFLVFIVTVLFVSGAWAGAFSMDIEITGSVMFDEGHADASGDVTQGGDVKLKAGAALVEKEYSGTTPPDPNPLLGTLTHIGDGLGVDGDVDAAFQDPESEFGIGIDMLFDIENSSPTDSYRITFRVDLRENTVDADGSDAYADSEFTVDDPDGEVFFSHLNSDTFYGDEVGGEPEGTFGARLTESGIFLFDLVIDPGMNLEVEGDWTLNGGAYESGSLATVDFDAFISVDNVENLSSPGPEPVPEPGTFLLLGSGLAGFAAVCRRRRKSA